jgi:hypothetical protein
MNYSMSDFAVGGHPFKAGTTTILAALTMVNLSVMFAM